MILQYAQLMEVSVTNKLCGNNSLWDRKRDRYKGAREKLLNSLGSNRVTGSHHYHEISGRVRQNLTL